MTTLLITRAHRMLLFSMAAILMASLLAPIATLANSDIVTNDTAVVQNGGANLRAGTSTTNENNILAELPGGTTVYVIEAPIYGDTGAWAYVNAFGMEGYVSTDLLEKVTPNEAPPVAEPVEQVVSNLPWLDPIEHLVVADSNLELTEQGLPVRTLATNDAPILGYASVGSTLEVTGSREWIADDVSFVRVNFNGQGGYVNGRYAILDSEVVSEEPTEDIIWTDEVPAEPTDVPEEPVTEEIPVDTTDTPQEPNGDETTAEIPTQDTLDQAPVVDEPAPAAPATPEDVVTPEEAPEDAVAPSGTPEADATSTEVANAAPETPADPPIASTVASFDNESMIGSATVTGTSDGLVCRAAPEASAPVLMTLSEGTKVLVFAEATNGYLGIDCGGLQGFADVNYLWSGGASDNQINAAKLDIVVTGTGNGLNCRTGAGLNYGIITTLFDGTVLVTRGKSTNGWTPVFCGGQNGFVSTTWVEVKSGANNGSSNGNTTTTPSSGSARVNADGSGLYCRSGAGTSYGIITVLADNSIVTVRGAQQGSWIPVTCGGAAGFAHADFLVLSSNPGGTGNGSTSPQQPGGSTSTGTVKVANTGGMALNCRSGAGAGFSVITAIPLGQSLQTRSGSVNGWTAVICGGANGFVSSEFVTGGDNSGTPTTPTEPSTPSNPSGLGAGDHGKTTAVVNLRYSASISAGISTSVATGLVVEITGPLNGEFYPVNYDGLVGFMHKDYLVKTSDPLSKRGGSGQEPTKPTVPSTPEGNNSNGNAMVNYAMRYLGYPYVWATHGPASFDCSGFTYWVTLNVMGRNIGAGTWTQVAAGTPVSRNALQPGDLVFFQNTYTPGLSHVGLYIGNGQFIHAQNEETGVVISSLDSSYYAPRWYGAVRL